MQERSCEFLLSTYLTIHTLKYKLFAIAAAEVKYILGYLAAPSVHKSRLTHLMKWVEQVHYWETWSIPGRKNVELALCLRSNQWRFTSRQSPKVQEVHM